jgi:hypothetical protein
MNRKIAGVSVVALSMSLGACATTGPAQPNVAVMPGQSKSYEAFQRDDVNCQASAQRVINYQSPGEVGNNSTITGAAVGTALGALAGAAIGSTSANAGRGAAIGAGTGLVAGTMIGASNAERTGGHDVLATAPPPPPVVVYERAPPVYVYQRPFGYGRPYQGLYGRHRW